MSDLIIGLYEDWLWLDERIETVSEIEAISHQEANCIRLHKLTCDQQPVHTFGSNSEVAASRSNSPDKQTSTSAVGRSV